MPTFQQDVNSQPIPALRPRDAVSVNGTSSALTSTIIRLSTSADANYGINSTATVFLPAGAIEYVRIDYGDTITTDAPVNVTEMD
jgi:hypothetical protein